MLPVKTMLAVGTVAGLLLLPHWVPALERFAAPDRETVAEVLDLPVPEVAPETPEPGPSINELRKARAEVLKVSHNPYLSDPNHTLDPFFAALEKAKNGRAITRVLHYGDSPTTADLITADVRSLMQKEYGDAGTGFVLIARPWAWYNHRGVEMQADGWGIDIAGQTELKDGLFGAGGVRFRGYPGAVANWTLRGRHHWAEVSFLASPEGGWFEFEADGVVIGQGDTWAEEEKPGYVSFELPEGSSRYTLRVTYGETKLFGVEFRKDRPGILYSSLGINGANITVFSRAFSNAHLRRQLQHYKPDLVVLGYGTNESGFPEFVDNTWGPQLGAAVLRIRTALPDASILLMSPMDRGELGEDGFIHTIGPLPRLVKKEAVVAEQQDVAFFNTFEAMGGAGTMARWYNGQPRLVGADYIHPMPAGAKIVGELLYEALQDGYEEYRLRKEKEAMESSGSHPEPVPSASVSRPGVAATAGATVE